MPEPNILYQVCNIAKKEAVYYISLLELGNITVKSCQVITHTFDGNEKTIPYEYLPKANNVTQAPDTSGFYQRI